MIKKRSTPLILLLISIVLFAHCSSESKPVAPTDLPNSIIELRPLEDESLKQLSTDQSDPTESEVVPTGSNVDVSDELKKEITSLKGYENNDPVYTLEELNENPTNSSAGERESSSAIYVTEVPPKAASVKGLIAQATPRSSSSQRRATAKKTFAGGPSLSKVKQLYRQGQYVEISKYTFTSVQLPQLYYKASAVAQLAYRARKLSREQIVYVQTAKQLYGRIAETTRDNELKGRSLLWLAILRWRYPAWSEDLEQQLAPLFYIQRHLKNTRVYNDAIFYSALIYQKYDRNDKAYRYYRRLEQTPADDWVYDDNIRKFTNPKRAAQWYIARLEQEQVKTWENKTTPVFSPNTKTNDVAEERPVQPEAAQFATPELQPQPSSSETFNTVDNAQTDDLQQVEFEDSLDEEVDRLLIPILEEAESSQKVESSSGSSTATEEAGESESFTFD